MRGPELRHKALIAAATALLLPLGALAAVADGDPASDVLVTQSIYVPFPFPSPQAQAALADQVRAVYRHGLRIKVAVIATPDDLGAIPSLFGHPADYAAFLGLELQFMYKGPLLIVMPAGFGIYDGGRPTAAAERVLAALAVEGSSPDALMTSAASAVRQLLASGALRFSDRTVPVGSPVDGSAAPGSRARLRYRVSDDSGYAGVTLTLAGRSGTRVAELRVPLRRVRKGAVYAKSWPVPTGLRLHTLRYCLVATDAAGNRSKKACASFLIG